MKIKGAVNNNLKNIFRALHSRNFRLYFTGQSISLVGTWIQMLAMSWLVYRLTGSVFILGLVGFFSRIPTMILSPFAGVIADRLNRYRLLVLTQVLSMVQAIVITILVLTNIVQVWHIIALGLVLGIINSFDYPIRQSLFVEFIEKKEDLGNAIALNSAMVNVGRLIGPTIAGILIAALGEGWCFLINAISFIAIIGTLLMMKVPPRQWKRKKDSHMKEFLEGFKYAFGFPPVRTVLLLLALVSLVGMPYQVLMPVFAKNIFGGGASHLGYLMSASGLGALVGAIYMASRNTVKGLGRIIVVSVAVFGVGLILFGIIKTFWLSVVILFFVGLGMMVEMNASNTILQTIVDDDKRGRIMSIYIMAFMGMVPFGNLLAGSLASAIGSSATVIIGGIACILGALYFAFRLPSIRKLVRPIYIANNIIPGE